MRFRHGPANRMWRANGAGGRARQPPGLAGALKATYPKGMVEAVSPALDRIERALARIEAAAAKRAFDADVLARRHIALREKVEDAVAALDALVERQSAS